MLQIALEAKEAGEISSALRATRQADRCPVAGDCEAAAQTLDGALAMVERTGERFYAAELHRLRGVILTERGAGEEAETHLMRALSIAHEQQSHGW